MNSTLFNLMTSIVGTGMNKGANSKKADQVTSPVLDALDIAGYNYASGRYPLERKAHPNRIILGSETWEANADDVLRISVTGGELLSFGSANPRTEECYQSGEFATYYGKAQAIVRADESGEIQVTVSGKKSGSATVKVVVSAED